MSDRPTAATITDAELDALYRKIAVAEKAATGERTFKWYADDAQRRLKVQRERAEHAEAAIDRARALASRWAVLRAYGSAATELRKTLDEQPTPAAVDLRGCPTPETHNWGCGCPTDEAPAAELRERCEAAVRMILAGTGAHTVDEWAQYVTAAVLPIFTSRIIKLTRERDLAIAHDRQPYPTASAYEQACAALHAHRDRAELLATTLDTVLRNFVHKGHPGEPCLQTGWISVRTVEQWRDVLNPPKEQPVDSSQPHE
ncbi:hypothetical protein AB0I66_21495 [Streptomyces sp. NPDC050439]|uniref:hypothetical protein n=1 Tax=unclassified Streptomyces TaxID=2593676 RepID=UPI0034482284